MHNTNINAFTVTCKKKISFGDLIQWRRFPSLWLSQKSELSVESLWANLKGLCHPVHLKPSKQATETLQSTQSWVGSQWGERSTRMRLNHVSKGWEAVFYSSCGQDADRKLMKLNGELPPGGRRCSCGCFCPDVTGRKIIYQVGISFFCKNWGLSQRSNQQFWRKAHMTSATFSEPTVRICFI